MSRVDAGWVSWVDAPLNYSILCGDFTAGYELVEIGGMSILRDPYSTHGKTTFYVSHRFGGRLCDNDAVKVLRA